MSNTSKAILGVLATVLGLGLTVFYGERGNPELEKVASGVEEKVQDIACDMNCLKEKVLGFMTVAQAHAASDSAFDLEPRLYVQRGQGFDDSVYLASLINDNHEYKDELYVMLKGMLGDISYQYKKINKAAVNRNKIFSSATRGSSESHERMILVLVEGLKMCGAPESIYAEYIP
jgi:hypothetical protein